MMTDKKLKAAKTAFDASIDSGITFIDTAEVYGSRVRNSFLLWLFLSLLNCAKKWTITRKQLFPSTCSFHSVR